MIRPKPRRWICAHCRFKNDPGTKKCVSCDIRRATRRTSLKARCDRMAAEIVKARAKGKCEHCGRPGALEWAHGWPRRHHNLRWETRAAFGLLHECHRYFTTHPVAWTEWMVQRLGVDQVNEFERLANETWDKDYVAVIAGLRARSEEA